MCLEEVHVLLLWFKVSTIFPLLRYINYQSLWLLVYLENIDRDLRSIEPGDIMELHLIRHGQTNWNVQRRIQGQSESILTDLGIHQAQVLGERLGHLDFDQVFCSTSLRTRQTAEHIFKHRDFNIEYLDSLREIGMGPWEGRLHDAVARDEPELYKHFFHEPHLFNVPGAETFAQIQQRIVTAVKTIVATFHQRQVMMVSHGTILKSFLCYIQQRPLSEMRDLPQLHNCSHSIVEVNADGSGRVVQYADQPVE